MSCSRRIPADRLTQMLNCTCSSVKAGVGTGVGAGVEAGAGVGVGVGAGVDTGSEAKVSLSGLWLEQASMLTAARPDNRLGLLGVTGSPLAVAWSPCPAARRVLARCGPNAVPVDPEPDPDSGDSPATWEVVGSP